MVDGEIRRTDDCSWAHTEQQIFALISDYGRGHVAPPVQNPFCVELNVITKTSLNIILRLSSCQKPQMLT